MSLNQSSDPSQHGRFQSQVAEADLRGLELTNAVGSILLTSTCELRARSKREL